jgi:hypothetical protein
MKNEIQERIERLKKEIRDYLKIASLIGIDEKTIQNRINIYLDDLSKLLKDKE